MTKPTLQQIRDHSPCRDGWAKLLKSLGNPSDMTTQVSIGQIARSNGAQDALWCLRCADFDRRDIIRCILPSVKRASVHTTDKRVAEFIDVIEQWLADDDAVNLQAAAYAAYAAHAAADAAARAAAYAAYAAYATHAADVAARAAADAAYAAYATHAADVAADAADAAYAAADVTERELQVEDICNVFP
jgi:hypothetical protein